MSFDFLSILAYIAGLLLILVFCRLFANPLKWVLRALLNGIIGGLILGAVNFAGGFAGISLIINPLTALLTGFLGIPGIILVAALQYVL